LRDIPVDPYKAGSPRDREFVVFNNRTQKEFRSGAIRTVGVDTAWKEVKMSMKMQMFDFSSRMVFVDGIAMHEWCVM
jgi:hypothetical protein